MEPGLRQALATKLNTAGPAYIRNLVGAEVAVLQGQFNVAKVLRAAAHTQRVTAMTAARLLLDELDPVALLETNRTELEGSAVELDQNETGPVRAKIEQIITVEAEMKQIIQRSIGSLGANPDILERDVPLSLWGCYGCGYIMADDDPGVCPVCGALAAEFEWFGPFYSATPEHLGRLTPAEMMAILEAIPAQVAQALAGIDDETLRRKPSAEEWCIKEIVGHMIETHLRFEQRVRAILESQGIPTLPRLLPPWKLHEGKGYEDMPADQLVERLTQARSASLDLMRNLSSEQWARRGTILGASNTVLDLGAWLTNNDRGHLAQLQRMGLGSTS